MMDTTVKSNSETIDPADWAYEVVQSKAHAYIKLIVQTLRTLMKDKGADIEISDAELARCTSLSERTVSRYRTIAEQEGWLSCRAGRGRAKVTFYRISVPMQTLCELAERIDGLAKNQTDSPLIAEENQTVSPTAGQKVTVSQTAGPVFKKEIPPTPPKEKTTNLNNNLPSLETARGRGRGIVADPFGLNPHMQGLREDVWVDSDDRLQVGNGFRVELEKLAGSPEQLRIELDMAAEWVGLNNPPQTLKAKVRGRVLKQITERTDRDRRYEKAKKDNEKTGKSHQSSRDKAIFSGVR